MIADKDFFCTDLAWEHGVPLVGSATQGDIWFLLEYRGSWGSKAFEESTVHEQVKEYLQSFGHGEKKVRILLIRQNPSPATDGLAFFVGLTTPQEPKLYQYQLEKYTDILNIDLHKIVSDKLEDRESRREEPLYLVCTNGRRDKCCAVYGPEIYQALVEEAGDAVWQSSHIAGHNQAPVMLFFPHGVNYAHATPSEARRLVRSYRGGQVNLHHYRGRVCFENHVQAAEHFWREQTGVLDLPGMVIENEIQVTDNQWVVTVRNMDDASTEQIHLLRRSSDFKIPITCTRQKESSIVTFHRIE